MKIKSPISQQNSFNKLVLGSYLSIFTRITILNCDGDISHTMLTLPLLSRPGFTLELLK